MVRNREGKVTLSVQTDRSGTTFQELAEFVDAVRASTDQPDEKVSLEFDYDMSDHESAWYNVDLNGDWNQEAVKFENGIVVRIDKDRLVDGLPADIYRYAYEHKELILNPGEDGDGAVHKDDSLPGGVCIELYGIGTFTNTIFIPVRRVR
tara:strand:+ start:130673 stop:131122 length:450 start_codon:yes stop_codon:yes gene_type:complete